MFSECDRIFFALGKKKNKNMPFIRCEKRMGEIITWKKKLMEKAANKTWLLKKSLQHHDRMA